MPGIVGGRAGGDVLDHRPAVGIHAELALRSGVRSVVQTPRNAGCRPALMWSMTGLACEIGMAKPTFCAGCCRRRRRGVDADDATDGVDQRTAGVAGIDRGVGLQDVSSACRFVLTVTVQAGDDPTRDAEPALERSALPIATTSSPTWTLLESSVHTAGRLPASTLRTATSALGSRPTAPRVERAAVIELELGGLCLADHVHVRREVAVRRQDEGRPRALASPLVHGDGGDGGLDLGDDAGDVPVATDRGRLRETSLVLLAGVEVEEVSSSRPNKEHARRDECAAQAADQRPHEELAETLRALGGRRRRAGRCGPRRDGRRLVRPRRRRRRGDGQDVHGGYGLIRHQSDSKGGCSSPSTSQTPPDP